MKKAPGINLSAIIKSKKGQHYLKYLVRTSKPLGELFGDMFSNSMYYQDWNCGAALLYCANETNNEWTINGIDTIGIELISQDQKYKSFSTLLSHFLRYVAGFSEGTADGHYRNLLGIAFKDHYFDCTNFAKYFSQLETIKEGEISTLLLLQYFLQNMEKKAHKLTEHINNYFTNDCKTKFTNTYFNKQRYTEYYCGKIDGKKTYPSILATALEIEATDFSLENIKAILAKYDICQDTKLDISQNNENELEALSIGWLSRLGNFIMLIRIGYKFPENLLLNDN